MAVVARYPDTVDKSLVIRMDGDGVPSFHQIIRHIDFIVEIVERIAGRGALVDEFSIDVQLVVVVGGDENRCVCRRIQCERFSEEDMLVSGLLVFRLEFRGGELAMEDVKRFEIGEGADGDPLSDERMGSFVLHSGMLGGLCMADDGQAGYDLTESFHSFPPLSLPYDKRIYSIILLVWRVFPIMKNEISCENDGCGDACCFLAW